MADLYVEINRARAHYAANRFIEDGVTFDDSHEDFDDLIAQVRKEAKAEALRDAQEIKLGNEYYEMLVEDELNARADQMEGDE